MLVEPVELKSGCASSRSVAALRPDATFRKVSAEKRTVTPDPRRVTCTVPQEHRVTRVASFDESSVWGPQEFFGGIRTSGERVASGAPAVTGAESSSFPRRERERTNLGRRVAYAGREHFAYPVEVRCEYLHF